MVMLVRKSGKFHSGSIVFCTGSEMRFVNAGTPRTGVLKPCYNAGAVFFGVAGLLTNAGMKRAGVDTQYADTGISRIRPHYCPCSLGKLSRIS